MGKLAGEIPRNSDPTVKTVYVRVDSHLKQRLRAQCVRLNITEAAIVKMALVKFIEEEEQIEADKAHRRK